MSEVQIERKSGEKEKRQEKERMVEHGINKYKYNAVTTLSHDTSTKKNFQLIATLSNIFSPTNWPAVG